MSADSKDPKTTTYGIIIAVATAVFTILDVLGVITNEQAMGFGGLVLSILTAFGFSASADSKK